MDGVGDGVEGCVGCEDGCGLIDIGCDGERVE